MKDKNNQFFSEFAALWHSEQNQPKARVDNFVGYFIHKAVGKDFLVENQVHLDLFVYKTKKDAIVDVSVCHHSNIKLKELVVVEDKVLKNVTGTLEAELIAQGIAAAQQNGWDLKWPVYLISAIGRTIQFYKATFL